MPRRERPLDSEDTELLLFAADLRRLRQQAGSPTYRELSRLAHFSAAALSEAAGGRKLPSLAVTLAFVQACGGDLAAWETRWRAIAAESNDRDHAAGDTPAPFVGLAPFEADDADRFFGRNKAAAELATMVSQRRFVGVFGASGSGKSSLLRAGLAGRTENPAVVFTPGARPVEECAVRLAAVTGGSAADWLADLTADPANLHLRIRQAMARDEDDLLLVVDQFEEVFTLCSAEDRTWLIRALTIAAGAATSRVRVVLGVRADFYGQCGQHPELVEALRGGHILIGSMTPDELRQAITGPAARAGYKVETALVARLVADANGQPAVLPLVSHALLETWHRRYGVTLTQAGYDAAGGIHHAVARSAENAYTTLDPDQQLTVRRLFLRLTAIGDRTEDTKRRIAIEDLDDDPGARTVLERLTRARLLVADHHGVEMIHEALIQHWPRLRDWLACDREGIRIHHRLTEAATHWDSLDHDPGALYRGTQLTIAREWSTKDGSALNTLERRFLDASMAAQATEHADSRRRAHRSRRLVVLLNVLLVLAVVAIAQAIRAQQATTEQRTIAAAMKAVSDAATIRAVNPALSLQLSLAAYRLNPSRETQDNLLSVFATPYSSVLTGYTSGLYGLAASQSGTILAAVDMGGQSGTSLWDISDPNQAQRLPSIPGQAAAVRISPDGRVAVTASSGSRPRLWDISNRDHPQELAVLDHLPHNTRGLAASLAFSSDGRILATSGTDRNVWLSDVSDPRNPKPLATTAAGAGDPTDKGTWVAFSPGRPILATISADGTARLWNITDPSNPGESASLGGGTVAVAFSPDGHTLATTGHDKTARLWNIADPHRPQELATLTGHTASVLAVAFSSDGHTLATTSHDKTVRLWDISSLTLANGTAMTLSSDGQTLAIVNRGTTTLWDVADRHRPRRLAVLPAGGDTRAVFGPNNMLATTNASRTTRLWDVTDPHRPQEIASLPTDAESVAFSPDGRLLATSGQLWNLTDAKQPQLIARFGIATASNAVEPGPGPVAFSPDSRILVTTTPRGITQVWDIGDPHQPQETTRLPLYAASSMAFRPGGGRVLATATPDATVRLWDITDARLPTELATIAASGQSPAFSPDGRTLTIVDEGQTPRLWDVSDPSQPGEAASLYDHTATVWAVSAGGSTIATLSDGVVRLWETDIDQLAAHICRTAYPRITRSEWDRHFPGLDYQPPCP